LCLSVERRGEIWVFSVDRVFAVVSRERLDVSEHIALHIYRTDVLLDGKLLFGRRC
jgi:hypothetical protein